jgi:predicted HicB family RNase H-like nuclease
MSESEPIKKFTLRIEASKLKKLRLIAVQDEITINALLISLVDDLLDKRQVATF